MPNPRRKARIAALQALYESDVSGHDGTTALDRLCTDAALSEAQTAFAHELPGGVIEKRVAIDEVIRTAATQWPVVQISATD